MSTNYAAAVVSARFADAIQRSASSLALPGGANFAIVAMPGTSGTSKWYRHPGRLMSQCERLPA